MSVAVVVGMQWGDEGKGKIIDLLAEDADVIARYAGGHNAGHTIVLMATSISCTSSLQVFFIRISCVSSATGW